VTPGGPQEIRVLAQRFNAMLEQLERNERERNVMLAGLPHDLRAPLTRLRLRLALLDDETRAGIARDADDIDRIAAQFIAYLRGAWGDGERREELMLLEWVAARAARYAGAGHAVTVRGDASVRVEADAEALGRLLDNLIDNAQRYGADPVEIDVAAQRGLARITVRDHGPGIAASDIARALEPFTRLDAARAGSGSCGLGLAIVERIARAHGGTVALRATDGGGLTVDITLAAKDAQ
jgi:two-component system osmolarity sensor histidine kinase EnvZ